LGLGTPHSGRREREAPTHRKKDKEKRGSLKKTSLSHKKIRTMEIQRKILRSGAASIRAPNITVLISTQINHWWSR
jgi:hypothetical protein